jgi:enoyl-CoA hydratase/carnithine racemase
LSAGADVSLVREATPIEARAFTARGHATADRIETLPKPVVAAVNGRAKELTNRAGDGDQAGNLARERDLFVRAFATEDQREGMAAYFEKRAPDFRGR